MVVVIATVGEGISAGYSPSFCTCIGVFINCEVAPGVVGISQQKSIARLTVDGYDVTEEISLKPIGVPYALCVVGKGIG